MFEAFDPDPPAPRQPASPGRLHAMARVILRAIHSPEADVGWEADLRDAAGNLSDEDKRQLQAKLDEWIQGLNREADDDERD